MFGNAESAKDTLRATRGKLLRNRRLLIHKIYSDYTDLI